MVVRRNTYDAVGQVIQVQTSQGVVLLIVTAVGREQMSDADVYLRAAHAVQADGFVQPN